MNRLRRQTLMPGLTLKPFAQKRVTRVLVWKAGAVMKIDLTTHEAVEVVGEISDRTLVERSARWLEIRHGFASG
jgi:hypothetical protein